MPEWLSYALTAAGAFLASWITFRVRFERFESMDQEREKAWWEWRKSLDENLREREERSHANADSVSRLGERMISLEKRVEGLHGWKHTVGEAYLPRAVDDHHRRLERLERKLFNGHREDER